MTTRVDFYHLTRDAAPPVVARLAERAIGTGARLLIVAADRDQQDAIDAELWTAIPESFLPHPPPGVAAGAEPIAIAGDIGPVTDVTAVIVADGVWRDEALAYSRALFLFDGEAIDGARAAWRALSERAGCERHFWKQDGQGRWREGP